MAEAEYNEEKGLLGPALKPHRRYGSTSVNMKKPDHVLVHLVSKGDTIQGIALKYGVTVSSYFKFLCIMFINKIYLTIDNLHRVI